MKKNCRKFCTLFCYKYFIRGVPHAINSLLSEVVLFYGREKFKV